MFNTLSATLKYYKQVATATDFAEFYRSRYIQNEVICVTQMFVYICTIGNVV